MNTNFENSNKPYPDLQFQDSLPNEVKVALTTDEPPTDFSKPTIPPKIPTATLDNPLATPKESKNTSVTQASGRQFNTLFLDFNKTITSLKNRVSKSWNPNEKLPFSNLEQYMKWAKMEFKATVQMVEEYRKQRTEEKELLEKEEREKLEEANRTEIRG